MRLPYFVLIAIGFHEICEKVIEQYGSSEKILITPRGNGDVPFWTLAEVENVNNQYSSDISLLTDPLSAVKKRVVIGVGTGRCGTKSFQKLLNKQPGTSITHETGAEWCYPDCTGCSDLYWNDAGHEPSHEERRALAGKRLQELQRRKAELVGDIAAWNLPYVEHFLELDPEVKILVLKRTREHTIRSLVTWFGYKMTDKRKPNQMKLPWVRQYDLPVHLQNGFFFQPL
mmetsp:Transcript_32551/g.45161  ORF Transcript_32551/g.45161 Transcript_32551/m.45161 type:complete len:229 (-) Transcript_32551:492-1178(-)